MTKQDAVKGGLTNDIIKVADIVVQAVRREVWNSNNLVDYLWLDGAILINPIVT